MTEEEFRAKMIEVDPVMATVTEQNPLYINRTLADHVRKMVGYLPAYFVEVKPLPTGDGTPAPMYVRT